mmetsp:Transcript_24310/g.60581  ORF Transcript_24310/g.60581 Transcript_24310/m.60581 type:complete len:109 (+) Transcript_24310:315-641(+)
MLRVRGAVGESCDSACKRVLGVHYGCNTEQLEFLNDCGVLAEMFACPEGCGLETGPDLPVYVVEDAPLETRGQCLVTEAGYRNRGALDCKGSFKYTRRACACIPFLFF